jgi:hypothetical protein
MHRVHSGTSENSWVYTYNDARERPSFNFVDDVKASVLPPEWGLASLVGGSCSPQEERNTLFVTPWVK